MAYFKPEDPMIRIRISWIIFFLLVISNNSSLFGQSDSLKQQVSLGIWPSYASYPFMHVEYKRFVKKKLFYDLSVEGFYKAINDGYDNDHVDYQTAASAALGMYFKFFRICRFSIALQLTGFYSKKKGIGTDPLKGEYDYRRSREGVFLGPELGLEARILRFKKGEFSLFGKIHTGSGRMHEEYFNNKDYPRDSDDKYAGWYGAAFVGLNYRFR